MTYEPLPRSDHYSGTADALIAAGVITAEQLPARSCVTYYKGAVVLGKKPTKDENFLRIYRTSAKRTGVTKGISSAEVKRRADEDRQRIEAERKHTQEKKEAAYNADPENLRTLLDMGLRMVEGIIADHAPGCEREDSERKSQLDCRFDGDGVEAALAHIREVQIWLENVGISKVGNRALPAANAARLDKAFQAFLQSQCTGGA
ncbi:hypothetical protein HK414_12940 [Ramlibacter terrae]|uniref:DUF3486 family protein n=1 Tax=Ramlibacter terrae TaxID=2732511 RepID=A0ABX6P5E7_9BURK|nr:hypothetical protein HK414_12940 [Ramlibacter terrae]